MGPEEVKALMRAYVALAMAQQAAEQFADAAAQDARFASVVKCQALAADELDCLLERAFSGGTDSVAPDYVEPDYVEEESSSLLM